MWTAIWIFLSALAVALIAPMVAHAIKLAEFRQVWINELRKDVADYIGHARRWARKWNEYVELDRRDASDEVLNAAMGEIASILNEARVIQWRIQMRINPQENESKLQDDLFLKAIADVTNYDLIRPYEENSHSRWNELADVAVLESRKLLKREWDVTKRFAPRWLVKTYHLITGL